MANRGIRRAFAARLKRISTINLNELPDDFLFDPEIAADILDTTVGTLEVWRSTGRYDLCFVKIGRRVKYRVGDIRAFLERRTQSHTGELVR